MSEVGKHLHLFDFIYCRIFKLDIYESFRIRFNLYHLYENIRNRKSMSKQNKPTAAELEILSILWERGNATVKEVHEVINARKPTGYTTVLKTMQIMREKNLVERDDANKAHIFRAVEAQAETQKNLVADLIEKVFRGSALKLVQHVLEAKPSSAEDLKEIRRMIKDAERKGETE